MVSFIIPAHNEERWIGHSIASIQSSMAGIDVPYEIVVVDDASSDKTPQIAQQMAARTIRVALRNISAVRNAGAAAASGGIFFFVDADTQVNERAVSAGLDALRAGVAGGGCVFEFDNPVPWWASLVHRFAVMVARRIKWVGGCFLFCTRDAFHATGGFAEQLRAGEDIAFVQALKKVGRFVVPKPSVVTSARKLHVVTAWDVVVLIVTIAIRGPRYESDKIVDILYGSGARNSKVLSAPPPLQDKKNFP